MNSYRNTRLNLHCYTSNHHKPYIGYLRLWDVQLLAKTDIFWQSVTQVVICGIQRDLGFPHNEESVGKSVSQCFQNEEEEEEKTPI